MAILISQQAIIKDLEQFVSNFDTTINRIFDERNVAAGGISEAKMKEIVQGVKIGLTQEMRELMATEIQRHGLGGNVQQPQHAAGNNRGQHQRGFGLHLFNGKFHRVPQDWRFPTCGLRQLWLKWNIGDTVNNIPPLRFLNVADLKHLDSLPIQNNEKQRPA